MELTCADAFDRLTATATTVPPITFALWQGSSFDVIGEVSVSPACSSVGGGSECSSVGSECSSECSSSVGGGGGGSESSCWSLSPVPSGRTKQSIAQRSKMLQPRVICFCGSSIVSGKSFIEHLAAQHQLARDALLTLHCAADAPAVVLGPGAVPLAVARGGGGGGVRAPHMTIGPLPASDAFPAFKHHVERQRANAFMACGKPATALLVYHEFYLMPPT